MDFEEALGRLGFRVSQERPARAVRIYSARPNRFLTYWVHVESDGTALFTWEFAITDYLQTRGMVLGSAEPDSVFLYPAEDQRGPQEAAWLAHAIEMVEDSLRRVDLSEPER